VIRAFLLVWSGNNKPVEKALEIAKKFNWNKMKVPVAKFL
jgi:hypothetical protein